MNFDFRKNKIIGPEIFGKACLVIVMLLGAIVITGWIQDITIFKTLLPGRPDMKANAAVGFFIVSLAIWLIYDPAASWWRRRMSQFLSLFAGIFSVLVLLEYAYGFDFGIDQFLFEDPNGHYGHSPPGRFSPLTAINFILISCGLLLDQLPRHPWHRSSQALVMFSFLISFQSFLGNLLGMSEIFGMALFIPMAVPTAFSFTAMATAFLTSRLDRGYMARFSSKTPSGVMARSMLIAVIFVPPIIKGFATFGTNAGVYSEGLSIFLQVIGSTIFMTIIVITTAGLLQKTELEREKLRIAERRALREAEAERDRLHHVFTQAPSHVDIYRGPDHIFELAHPQTIENAGQQEILGKKLRDVFPGLVDSVILNACDQVYRTGIPFSGMEVPMRLHGQPDEEIRYYNVSIQPWKRVDGSIEGVIVFSVDVTVQVAARRIVEQNQVELRKAKEEAEQASLAKSQFLANMSHEIRTPLGVILGFSDLAMDPTTSVEEAKTYLNTIRRNAEELTKLVGEILDLSKVEAQKLEVEKLQFSLKQLMNDVLSVLNLKAAEKGIQLEFKEQSPLPEQIICDPTRIRQILLNLVGNAIKFTREGWVRVYASAETLELDRKKVKLRLIVQDSGIGISEEQRSRLFQSFSQADSSMSRKFGGTGLGLILSRELARALGGDLELVQSSPKEGSTFAVTILAESVETVESAGHSAERNQKLAAHKLNSTQLSGLSILLVEDATDNQVLICRYLQPTGAHVTVANNGLQGLYWAQNKSFDVVLMDIQMPVMDGFSATAKLRQKGYSKPIVALTAHAVKEEREKALNAGFDAYLTKPINKAVLFETLQEILIKKTSNQALSGEPTVSL